MYQYTSTILSQLLSFLPKDQFKHFVGQHNGDRYTKTLSTWNQLTTLLYAQATGKESLREIETGLKMNESSWYHLGVKSVARSTLSYANTNRDYQIFEKLFYAILERCQDVVVEKKFSFNNPLYALDASTIRLCLSVFDWAKYTKTKGALKLHTLLDIRTTIPQLVTITDGKVADITEAKKMTLNLEKGSIVAFDRGYVDYKWWNRLDEQGLFFVVRTKKKQSILVVGQHQTDLEADVLADERVTIGDYDEKYPKVLRRVRYYDRLTDNVYEYLTNNFELSAQQIAEVYKSRWQIELFFKWIKQNLKIKTFLGTTENAVMSQIWIAMIYYLLLSYIKFQTKFSKSLLELTRMIRETILVRRSLIDLLSLSTRTISRFRPPPDLQRRLF
jgi:hypothetical protein